MHLLVLSAFRRRSAAPKLNLRWRSQCTFWCSVLSDWEFDWHWRAAVLGLNAPFGAQCFPTGPFQAHMHH